MKGKAQSLAKDLVLNHGKEMDLERNYSHGKGGAKNFIAEQQGGKTVSFTISNAAASTNVAVAIGSLSDSIYADNAEAIAALGVQCIIGDGTILTVETDKNIVGTSNDAGRTIAQLMKYIGRNATRITGVHLQSQTAAGAAETSNYNGSIAQVWTSPFDTPDKEYLPLRKFQSNRSNSPEFADIDFIKEGRTIIWSAEHFTVFTINAGTTMTFTFNIGMQDSAPQRLYRNAKKADRVLAPYRG